MKLGYHGFDETVWDYLKLPPVFAAMRHFSTQFWQISPLQPLGQEVRRKLRTSAYVSVILDAQATRLRCSPEGSAIEDVEVRSSTNRSFRVQAEYFVLACGAVQNVRLLLLSNEIQSRGVGNEHDLVGRFYMDHVHVPCATFVAREPHIVLDVAGIRRRLRGHWFKPVLRLVDTYQREQASLNCSISIEAAHDAEAYVEELIARQLNKQPSALRPLKPKEGHPREASIKALRKLRRAIMTNTLTADACEQLLVLMRSPHAVLRHVYRYFIQGRGPIDFSSPVVLYARSEQAPNPDSRITLSEERDEFGLNRISLDWRLSEIDHRTIRVMAEAAEEDFARLNLGEARILPWLTNCGKNWPGELLGGLHQMGTTRMAESPRAGVVDRDCRVHGVRNLFIAGGSVFPTGGWANPTFTIVALALRLGDHLKKCLAS